MEDVGWNSDIDIFLRKILVSFIFFFIYYHSKISIQQISHSKDLDICQFSRQKSNLDTQPTSRSEKHDFFVSQQTLSVGIMMLIELLTEVFHFGWKSAVTK